VSKAEQLRAMREAAAEERAVRVKKVSEALVKRQGLRVRPLSGKPALGDGVSLTSISHPPKPTKRQAKARNGSGKRFVPNKTKGRPHTAKAHLTNEARKPWEEMKVSRRTWYRKMAKQPVI
jgi:hypothetical protein